MSHQVNTELYTIITVYIHNASCKKCRSKFLIFYWVKDYVLQHVFRLPLQVSISIHIFSPKKNNGG